MTPQRHNDTYEKLWRLLELVVEALCEYFTDVRAGKVKLRAQMALAALALLKAQGIKVDKIRRNGIYGELHRLHDAIKRSEDEQPPEEFSAPFGSKSTSKK